MSEMPAQLTDAFAKFDALNADFLLKKDRSEAELAAEMIEVLNSIDLVDFKQYGEVVDVSEEVSICHLYTSDKTIFQVNYLAPNAFYPAHDHKDFIAVMRVVDGPLHVQTFAYADGKRPDGKEDPADLKREKTFTSETNDTCTILTGESHIHHIATGPEGGVFIDVLTMYKNPGSCRFFDSTQIDENAETVRVNALFDLDIQ